ncbi:hypothetical protein N0V93_009258 [Gnomoniopsis smithogilvyi]|uniref:Uncharacterized protein n=1 Tax=Gnomoniopsis smithogilvyi TaxID=1191159 RepID=A0A9W8YKI1_9PEZI|nr:hypothetical protein N0V93_009258 [Gnomoniopsis smithogilvyi]
MFGSRKNRTSNPPINASTVSPSAASAALTAFRRDSSASNSSLSAAAAAAALRARPTTPTNVAQVQTKRTLRRSASASSNAHSSPDRGPSLRRQSSSGSMTGRTFRSPSPGPHQRSLSSGGTPRTPFTMSDVEAPPVPAIPESVNMAAAKARGGARPKSLGFVTTPVKTASQKMAEKEQRGSWFGAAKVGDLGNVRKNDAVMRTPAPQTQQAQAISQPEEPRSESRGSSVNFSYPARVRVASPTPGVAEEEPLEQAAAPRPRKRSSTLSPQRGGPVRSARSASIASDRELVYDPNSRRMVSRAELQAQEQTPRPKKKKSALNRAGSHLARGTMSRAQGSAVDNGVPNEAQMAAAASLKSHRVEGRQQIPEEEEEVSEKEDDLETGSELQMQEERPLTPEPPFRQTLRIISPASNVLEAVPSPSPDDHESGLQRRPSVVREETEDPQSETELEAPTNAAAALDTVPVRNSVYPHGVPSPPQSENTDDLVAVEMAAAATSSPEPPTLVQEKPESRHTQSIRRESRAHSNSPVRSAHFGPVQETLTVKHEPPVRSLSPRKSALKRSPSRGTSPNGDHSDASGVDTPTQEPLLPRKKPVRVSFDDEKTIVLGEAAGRGETDSPVPPSPQQVATGTKKPWYNTLGIGRKKDLIPLEEDELMKPRPVLPMFGSIRSRKMSPEPAEERALVRPHEPLEEVSESSSPELNRRTLASENIGQSSDHALGSVINDQSVRTTAANISKQREPLPPVVTSIEGSGYLSDSTTSEDEAALLADTPKLQTEESAVSQASTLVQPTDSLVSHHKATDVKDFGVKHADVPSISLTQPSPQPEQRGNERESYLRFPGGFPETETETDGESGSSPTRQVTFEPVVQAEDATATAHTPSTVLATQHAVQEPADDSEDSSVYSDAHEDLSDIEGDGFLSLDAVVDSPVMNTPPRRVLEKAQAQRAEMVTPTPQSQEPKHSSAYEPEDQWAAAKAYWRSLTADKRAQLEKEATEEAGSEADLEDVQSQAKKPRRKKSVEKRNAEKKAIEQQRTAAVAADAGRTYMIKPGTKAGPVEYGPLSTKASEPRITQQSPPEKAESGARLRKSMRGSAEPKPLENGTHMRKSMRAAADSRPVQSETHMRKSMRSQPIEQQAAKQRPVSHQPLGNITEISSNRTKHARSMSESSPTAAVLQSSLRRRGSDSSASSFRRARPATRSGGFGFRKTMRAGAPDGLLDSKEPVEQQISSHRVSLRGASPPVTMRTTLRGERRRSSESGNSYLRFPGSSGKGGKKGTRKSRFGDDSSDEDEGLSRRFTSRFEDSSDEDLAPAEPLPTLSTKTMRSGRRGPPSPPLPEEEELSDDEAPIAAAAEEKTPGVTSADSTLRRSRSGRGLEAGPRKRNSFMSSVLRRNKKHDGVGKITRPDMVESAARRDTNLERSADELMVLRSNSGQSSPKLQKRVAPTSNATSQQDWPLSLDQQRTHETVGSDDKDVFYDAADGREAAPVASSRSPSVLGHSKSQPSIPRPAFLMRRTISTNGTINTDGVGSQGGEVTRKKKKFGALRKMLRLDE